MFRDASSVFVSHGFTPEVAQLTGNAITKTYTIGELLRGDIKLYPNTVYMFASESTVCANWMWSDTKYANAEVPMSLTLMQ